MGINQAIYTSSAHGINKGGGLGVHSYNYSCNEKELREFELSYCQYYFDGDAENITKLPTKVIYGITENGRCMEACVTYLGKDYDKERGRMGNLLSHMYSFAKEDMQIYPMQLYGSPAFKTSIALDEVDGTKAVDYLPEINTIRKGNIVSVEHIQDFLSGERLEMFCHLLSAVLQRDHIHKVIINDTHENIIMWLGAIEFALPVKCAKEITFSSYERDPMMSEFDIRGAVAGLSIGNYEDYIAGGQFHVFDGINMEYPQFDISADYFQYGVEMGLAFSYDSLIEFFKFMDRYAYEKADMDILLGFKLYQMIQGGIGQFTKSEFEEAIFFETKYGDKSSYQEMLTDFLEKMEGVKEYENLVDNMRMLLTGYLKKKLTPKELLSLVQLFVNFDKYIECRMPNMEAVDRMWQSAYEIFASDYREDVDMISGFIVKQGCYKQLAGFEAYLYRLKDNKNDIKFIESIFERDWRVIPQTEYPYFDKVVCVAVNKIMRYEDQDERYSTLVDLFLLLQDIGKGNISGRGMEQLIRIIEKYTKLTDKKQFARKRKGNEELENRLAKCAFEAFNYIQKNRVALPIAKIRLQHLGKSVVKIYDESRPLTKSKALRIYEKYPVAVDDVEDEDFEIYINYLAEALNTLGTEKDEYYFLLRMLILNRSQKEIVLSTLMDYEVDYFRKEKEVEGVSALLWAVKELGDSEYQQAMNKYVSEMKSSYKAKISESMSRNCDNELYKYWMKMKRTGETRDEKKGFFGFGKNRN